jgi:hypothetical protein
MGDFACSRCAHRQAEDAPCGQCGNDVVQDMRDPSARRVLYDAESRWQKQRQTRAISIAAVPGLVLFYPSCLIGGWIIGFGVALGAGVVAVAVLDRLLGERRRFPYLDEYEKSPERS